MQEETRLRRLAEEAAADAERESKMRGKRVQGGVARWERSFSKAGTTEVRGMTALHNEMIQRRLKEAYASGKDEAEALQLAAEDIKQMLSEPGVQEYTVLKLVDTTNHLEIDADQQKMWASCANLKCSLRLVKGYFICKGCIHAAWCCTECYEAHKEDHKKVWILCPTTLSIMFLTLI